MYTITFLCIFYVENNDLEARRTDDTSPLNCADDLLPLFVDKWKFRQAVVWQALVLIQL